MTLNSGRYGVLETETLYDDVRTGGSDGEVIE